MQLGLDEFSSLMRDLPDMGPRFVVAVSGGADSLALCLLSDQWAQQTGRKMIALSVDHGLRAQSGQECLWLAQLLKNKGIEHHILRWEGEKPTQGIQAAARQARYELLGSWCAEHGISDLLLAHHLDDQAETFLLRLARGSGVDGLGAMQEISYLGDLRLIRPLLNVPKSALKEYLQADQQEWIEDPSNENQAFDRVKVRQNMELLGELGLDAQRLCQTAQTMQRASRALQEMTQKWLQVHMSLFEEGYVLIDRDAFSDLNPEICLRALSRIGMYLGQLSYPPRLERLERLRDNLVNGNDATLMGCRWIVRKTDILACREVRDPNEVGNLYKIDCLSAAEDVTLRLLDRDGWLALRALQGDNLDTHLPKPVIYALVSFWDETGILAVPHLNFKRAGSDFEASLTLTAKNRLLT